MYALFLNHRRLSCIPMTTQIQLGAVRARRGGSLARRYFGQAAEGGAGGGGIDTAAKMISCIAAGGFWDGANCFSTTPGEEGEEIDLTTVGVTPGAVPVREANWDLEACTYRIASGDTFVGLAATYLGDGGRWREIWEPNADQFPDPDTIMHTGPLDMRGEACDRMKAFVKKGKPPGTKPGDLTPDEVNRANRSKVPFIIAGVVGVAAVAAIGIAVASS